MIFDDVIADETAAVDTYNKALWYQCTCTCIKYHNILDIQYLLNSFCIIYYVILFQLGKWKHGQSQSVDCVTSQHRGDTYKVIKDADSLDSGLQGPLIESELGSSGQENHHSVEKEKPSQKNGTTTTSHPEKSHTTFSKMTSRMKQASRENKIEEPEKPKASWSEHVWSKYFCINQI